MQIDQTGLDFIESFEGCRQFPYQDSVNVWTVGIGHKILPGEDYSSGLTLDQARSLLTSDLLPTQSFLSAWTKAHNISPTQNQWNALCSFSFNLGVGALQTMLAHGWAQVPTQILLWNHAGGIVVAGLTRRRLAEVELFEG